MAILTQRVTWGRKRGDTNRHDISGKLTPTEQANVRQAMKALLHYGTWSQVARVIGMKRGHMEAIVIGRRFPQAGHALRIARVMGVSIDEVLGGKIALEAMLLKFAENAGACPHCGRAATSAKD